MKEVRVTAVGGRREDGGKGIGDQWEGKARQVYVEKRRKWKEEWEWKTEDMERKERAA